MILKQTFFLLTFIVSTNLFAQTNDSLFDIPYNKIDSLVQDYIIKKNIAFKKDSIKKVNALKKWTFKNKPSIVVTQTSFFNWTKGGNNTISGIASFEGNYHYKKGQLFWKNDLLFRYGIAYEENVEINQKTDDIIDIKSTVGYKTHDTSKWYYSGDFDITTQFTEGFSTDNPGTVISNFFAPARLRLGIGATYNDDLKKIKINLSPITNQTTFVLDKNLANSGAFGVKPAVLNANGDIVTPGKKVNLEFGALAKLQYQNILVKNITWSVVGSFYSDYLENFGNIDVDIALNLNMKVNEHIQGKFNSHLLYDDDATIIQQNGTLSGPRAQLKQILGIGFSYTF